MRTPPGFLFDMDGLLLDTERVWLQGFQAATKAHGIARAEDEAFFLTLVGSSDALTRKRLAAYLPATIEPEGFFADLKQDIRRRLDLHVPLRPTVLGVLEDLAAQSCRMAVVTSTHKANALHHLENAGILPFFEHVTGGDEVAHPKPDPAPYVETAAHLGLDPGACFAFEDSDPGITAAMAAGCIATQIPDMRPPNTPLPDLGQRVAADLRSAFVNLGVLR